MIHKYSINGIYIVLDVNSGSVHVVDKIAYDILDLYKIKNNDEIIAGLKGIYNESDINEALEEIEQLEHQGSLFYPDIYEETAAASIKQPVVKALCMHIAHACNLKCRYCFAGEGQYRGSHSMMSFETGKNAIDYLIKSSGKRKNLEIDFFGGEPSLNFNVVKKIVDYAKSREDQAKKNFRFTLTTNGVLLDDDMIKYINKNMHNIVLSIDGRKEVNDKMRKTTDGNGSYDIIAEKFKKIADSRNQTDYYVRGTFTNENLDFSEDVLHLYKLGFKQISVEPVVAGNEPYAIREEHLPSLYLEYEKLAVKMLEMKKNSQDFNFFHFMIDLSGGPCVVKRLTGCGAGTEYLAVTPEGELYPCHQFVGINDFKMGDVINGVTNHSMYSEFDKCNVYSKNECKKCWAKFYCSGGCAASAYHTHGNILEPYDIGCRLQRKRIECAIMLKAAECV